MEILFLTHYFPPEGNAPASRTYEHAKRWVASGASVTVVTGNPNVPHGRLYPGYHNRWRQVEFIDGIRVIRVWTYLAANAGNIRRTLNYLSYMVTAVLGGLTCSRPNVIIATSPQFFCGWAGVILSRLRRVKFVLEIRDIWPDSIAAVGAIKQPLALRCLSVLERWMYQAADQIVTVGNGYRTALLERKVPSEKITVIPNGADLDRFKLNAEPAEIASAPSKGEPFRCLYVGTIGMASRLDLVLEAARTLQASRDSDIQFLIVGDGADRARLELEAQRSGLQNVLFTGLVPKSEIPSYIQSASVCLVHLRKDSLFKTVLPSKMFEAMAMEKPIILGVEGSAAELLEEAHAGLTIPPEDSQQLLTVLRRLKKSPEECRQFGSAGRQFVKQRYNRDHFADIYLSRTLEKCR